MRSLSYDGLVTKLDELEDLFSQYIRATNLLSGSDLENIEETDLLIGCRRSLIERMEGLQIHEMAEQLEAREREIVLKMLSGENIFGSLSDDENIVYSKILNIKSLQGEIVQKDKANNSRFMNKYNETKKTLTELKGDKKKIDFYNNARISEKKGRDFSQNV
ncbi:MAG: hypothetical protein FWH05_01015 [Oscillospiraceae bacterium]|nr:hypothetical protein [Oscillospiraceae bacterium]